MNKTDKNKLCDLFDEFEIGFKQDNDNNIICETGMGNVDGYSGFTTWFGFDKSGKFIKMDIGE